MSFKTNVSIYKKPSCEDTVVQRDKQIIVKSIGATDNGTRLSCRINPNGQAYHYFRAELEVPSIFGIVDIKLQREAFVKIQKYTNYQQEEKNSVFLLDALHRGNYGVMSKFLERLKTNRVQSYVKLNISQRQGHFQKPLPLLKMLTELYIQKMREAFSQMRKPMHRQILKKQILLDQLQKISVIHNKDNSLNSKQSGLKTSLINVSYTCIKTDRMKLSEITDKRTNTTNKYSHYEKMPQLLDFKEIMQIGKVKQYQFKNIDLKKVSINRIKTGNNF